MGRPGYAAPCDSCPLTARPRAKPADRRRAHLPRRGFSPHLGSLWPPWIRRAVRHPLAPLPRLPADCPPPGQAIGPALGAKPRPLTSPPPPAGLDPHPASPQTASLLQARRAIHGYEDTASRRSGEYSVAPQLPATLRSLLPGTSAYHHAGPVDGMCTTLEDAPRHVSYSWETTNCRQNATAR